MPIYPMNGGTYNGIGGRHFQQNAAQYANATPEQREAMKGDGSLLGRAAGWWNDKNAPQIGANPYQGGWDALIAQLTDQANGQGPSLAGNAYMEAQQTGMQNVLSMSRGGSAGAARAGMQNLGKMNQGLAHGYSNARLQESLAARQQLQAALAGAGNAWFQPQQLNLQAQMNAQSNGQQLMNFIQQGASTAASIYGMGATPQAAAIPGAQSGPVIPTQYNRNTGPVTSPSGY